MTTMTGETHLVFKRARFSTRLPRTHRFTQGHLWLRRGEGDEDVWEVGFTKFALRMLGDPVEADFEVRSGAAVETGQVIGWIEGFKAVTDVFAPFDATFAGMNPALADDIDLIKKSPYDKGWLYALRGAPGSDCLDAEDYAALLDGTIDRMLAAEGQTPDGQAPETSAPDALAEPEGC